MYTVHEYHKLKRMYKCAEELLECFNNVCTIQYIYTYMYMYVGRSTRLGQAL